MNFLVVTVGIISTTLGQSLLLHLFFPAFVAAHELLVLLGLLAFNSSLAILLLLFY